MPDKLQHVKMEWVDYATCTDAVKRLTGSSPVDKNSNVCTGPLYETISACSVSLTCLINLITDNSAAY